MASTIHLTKGNTAWNIFGMQENAFAADGQTLLVMYRALLAATTGIHSIERSSTSPPDDQYYGTTSTQLYVPMHIPRFAGNCRTRRHIILPPVWMRCRLIAIENLPSCALYNLHRDGLQRESRTGIKFLYVQPCMEESKAKSYINNILVSYWSEQASAVRDLSSSQSTDIIGENTVLSAQ